MEYINISHKKEFHGTIHSFSSEMRGVNEVNNLIKDTGYWSTERKDTKELEYVIIDYHEIVTIDYIELTPAPDGQSSFPKGFRIEGSLDGKIWEIIHSEKNVTLDSDFYKLDIPLTQICLLKIVITDLKQKNSKYISEIGKCTAGISGLKDIKTSGSSSSDKIPENLLESDHNLLWESNLSANSIKEFILVDLGKIFQVNKIVLGSSIDGFPGNFRIETSNDKEIWSTLFEEKSFNAEPFQEYFWKINIIPARYIRIEAKGVILYQGQYGTRLSGLKIFSAFKDHLNSHSNGNLTQYSSIFQPGIVKLAKDGEDSSGTAVQGSDIRLRNATTIFKGIVQMAEDREESMGLVVQASDSRLKEATELKPGVVRLAYDREIKPNIAVQGNDSRLQIATSENFGIVKLCPDGLNTENGVVTGSDSRIQNATSESSGICRLAEDGDSNPGSVIQSNDKRLRNATTTYKGIMELAEDGENKADVVVQGNDKRLKDATTRTKGIVELAENGESNPGVVVQGNDKRLFNATTNSKGIVELAENGEDRPGVAVQGNDRRIKEATTESNGIVELAEDGENIPGVVVQGNDKRLKDATETLKGILKFACDGETTPLTAVQGNDKRLRDATTTSRGIVELAGDGEDTPGCVVQGNDKRLCDATTDSKGIVELADDGEDRPGVAVQGNDRRLKEANDNTKGIMRFAVNGEEAAFAAVQSNDRRLKDAQTTSKGIVELAEDGENIEGVAVQGNDRRLKDATETTKGIVELAEDGEDKPGVVVQGNDKRLKGSTEEYPGIVRLAKSNEVREKLVVQSNDDRLSNARTPLEHTHDYATSNHEYNTHSGTISIKGEKNEIFKDITPPSDNSSVIQGVNDSKKSGSIGIAGVAGILNEKSIQSYGIVGHSSHVGVRGQSSGNDNIKGCGVLGVSRFGAGGLFSSEHTYSLIADGYGINPKFDDSIHMTGNGKAFYVNGNSKFNGQIYIQNVKKGNQFPANIVEMFEVNEEEYISPGDLLSVSNEGNSILVRSRKEYSKSVIGVVSGNPTLVLYNSGVQEKAYPVTLSGKAFCKVDARNNPINPGDLIVTSSTPGCGMAGKIDSFDKIGTVIGKALDKIEEGIGIISIFLTHQ